MVVTTRVVLKRLSEMLEAYRRLSMLRPSATCHWPIWETKEGRLGRRLGEVEAGEAGVLGPTRLQG